MSLILAILRWLEDQPAGYHEVPDVLPGYDDAERVRYHVKLAHQAGFLEARGKGWHQYQLTWVGHQQIRAGLAQPAPPRNSE